MKRILIFGNSGSGKSTLAKSLSETHGLAHLDLDTIAWNMSAASGPVRKPIHESQIAIEAFTGGRESWVIEGCYSDLLALLLDDANEMVFLNLPVEACIENAKNRPWEAHKYESKAAQDANLDMLIDWIKQYDVRDDTFSKAAHLALYQRFNGNKTMYVDNQREG